MSLYINREEWEKLPKHYQSVLESASMAANLSMNAKYDVLNPQALRKLVAAGAQLRPFSREIMDICYKSAYELYDELAASNPKFKKLYEPWKKFRDDAQLWWRVGEITFDNYVLGQAARR